MVQAESSVVVPGIAGVASMVISIGTTLAVEPTDISTGSVGMVVATGWSLVVAGAISGPE